MTGVLRFETGHGPILVEVDEAVARRAQAATDGAAASGLIAKGSHVPAAGEDVIANAPTSFGEAMSSLRAYAASLQDVIGSLERVPKQVSVEIGLKISGEAGWIIAKAGASAEVKVALTWEPAAANRTVDGKQVRAVEPG